MNRRLRAVPPRRDHPRRGAVATAGGLLALTAALVSVDASAEPDRIEPDRRDFTTGTGIVPLGRIQVEGGVSGERGTSERQVTVGEVTLRIPLSDSVEVHVGVPSYLIVHSDARRTGFDDASLEARYRFLHGEKVDFGLQLTTTLPTGTRRVAERRFEPGVVLASSITLSEKTELVVDVGATRASDAGQRYTQTSAAASFRVDVAPRVNAFAEMYAFNREEAGGSSHRYLDVGAVYYVDRDTALDARVGHGLRNGDGTQWLAGFGISRRF